MRRITENVDNNWNKLLPTYQSMLKLEHSNFTLENKHSSFILTKSIPEIRLLVGHVRRGMLALREQHPTLITKEDIPTAN